MHDHETGTSATAWWPGVAWLSCIYNGACMIDAANQSLVFEGHDISSCRFCAADGEYYPFPKAAKFLSPRWLLPAYGLRNHIQASVLLAIIRCLSPVSHVVHFAILHLPSTVLQHPDVIAPVKDAESLVDVIKSILDPV